MSVWTHVAGFFRLDSLVQIKKETLIPILGTMVNYDDPPVAWENAKNSEIPTGSEGSLEWDYDPGRNDNEPSLARGIVYAWGDLRDYDNANDIGRWIIKVVKGLQEAGITIRTLLFHVTIENDPNIYVFMRINKDLILNIIDPREAMSKEKQGLS